MIRRTTLRTTVIVAALAGALPLAAPPGAATAGARIRRGAPSTTAAAPSGAATSVATALHSPGACATTSTAGAMCWGTNGAGEVGDGTTTNRHVATPVVGLASGVAQVAVGSGFACARMTTGRVRCWGEALKNGTTHASLVPVVVPGLTNVVQISAGTDHACAVISGGTLKCWGLNDEGQLGNGTTTYSATPVTVGLSGVNAVAAGFDSTCAIAGITSALYCWGDNAMGGLGVGSDDTVLPRSTTPLWVPGVGLQVTSVSLGVYFGCAIGAGGTAFCWGWNDHGQVGANSVRPWEVTPLPVAGLGSATFAIDAGYSNACAISGATHALWCWGNPVGNGGTTDHRVPVAVPNLTSGVTGVAVGIATCVTQASGYVRCFGPNTAGEVGDATTIARPSPVYAVGIGPANASLLWLQPGTGAAYLSTLRNGSYSPKRSITFTAGWTHVAITRDTAFFYNANAGTYATGMLVDGSWTSRFAAPLPLIAPAKNVVATSDSVLMYSPGSHSFLTWSTLGGFATMTDTITLNGSFDTVVASADTVLFYDSATGAGFIGTLKGGVWTTTTGAIGFSPGWDKIVATDDSILLTDTASLAQVLGTLKGGAYATVGTATQQPCTLDRFAGTADSIIDERICGTSAPVAYLEKFTAGTAAYTGSVAPDAKFTLIVGGR